LAALAATLAELGDLDAAVASYDRAIKSPWPEVRIRAVEQQANLGARLAVQMFKVSERTGADRASAVEKIRLAMESIENLASLAGDTFERWSLRGSCWKRLAQIEQVEACDAALRRMAECYNQAKTAAGKDIFYPQLQWAAAGIARKLCYGHPAPRGVRLAVSAIAKMPEDLHNFWRDIANADANLLGAILVGAIDRKKETELLAPYRTTWRFGGSPLKLMSVLDQFTFFEDVLADAPEATKPLADALGRMRSTLEGDLRSAEQ
jgi:Tetratricopeptide Repeats-Sensor